MPTAARRDGVVDCYLDLQAAMLGPRRATLNLI